MPNTGSDINVGTFYQEWLGNLLHDIRRYKPAVARIRKILQNEGEFVASDSAQGIRIANSLFQPLCNADKKSVSHQMSHCVVDCLETVEIDEQQAEYGSDPPRGRRFDAQADPKTSIRFGNPVRGS